MKNSFIKNFLFWYERNNVLKNRRDGKFNRRQELRMMARLKKNWKIQEKYLLKATEKIWTVEESLDVNTSKKDIDKVTNNIPRQEEVTDAIMTGMSASMLKGGKTSVKRHNFDKLGISFSLKNKEAIKFLSAERKFQLSNKEGTIHDTTKKRINKILRDSADSGRTYTETAKLISEQTQAGVFSRARGQMIATNQIGIAYEEGNSIPIRDFKKEFPKRVVEKSWQTVGDSSVTEECNANAAEGWIDYEKEFSSDDQLAPRHSNPRCRCFTADRIN